MSRRAPASAGLPRDAIRPRRAARSKPRGGGAALAAAALLAVLAAGCHTDMYDQPKFRPLEETSFFKDGNSARPLLPDTVARGQLNTDELLETGTLHGEPADVFPFPVTARVLRHGQEQFNIFCSPCHGRVGDGRGMIVQRGFKQPPSYHTDRLRQAPAGHFFDVITNGFGAMYDYRSRISPETRWAIIAYIRALQLSQHAKESDVPAGELFRLRAAPAADSGTEAGDTGTAGSGGVDGGGRGEERR
jgi:Cytochrome C oxidase, cbb3-type, subunit III